MVNVELCVLFTVTFIVIRHHYAECNVCCHSSCVRRLCLSPVLTHING